MSKDYYNYKKCLDDLTCVLSIAYQFNYSMKVIEKRISKSKYFSLYNSSFINDECYITTDKLLDEIFYDAEITDSNILYNELEWVASMYIYLINKTNYNFETLFLYIGIEEAMKMYKTYHELDLNASLRRFKELQAKSSIINLRMKELKMQNNDLNKLTNLSVSMIDSLRNRRREIKKLDVAHSFQLAEILKIKIETLLNN